MNLPLPAAEPDSLAAKINRLRHALYHGGSVLMEDASTLPMDPPVLACIAQMVHSYDVLEWSRSGEQGPEPSLIELLNMTRVDGQHLSETEFVQLLAEHPHLDSLREELMQQCMDEDIRLSRRRVLPSDVKPHRHFQPREVVKLRREITDWLATANAFKYYQDAIDHGRQPVRIRKPGTPDAVALAFGELDGMRNADLYFIDEDMCQLLTAAHPTMPDFAAVRGDLPSEYGFAVFALPISHHYNRLDDSTAYAMITENGVTDLQQELASEGTQVIAVSWRPHIDHARGKYWPGGGVWMTLYAIPKVKVLAARGGPDAAVWRAAGDWLAPVCPENEAAFAWYPADGSDDAPYKLTMGHGTLLAARVVLAAFQLARQANLSDTTTEHLPARPLPKSKRRRVGDQPKLSRDVRVVRLRSQLAAARDAEAPDATGKSRDYRHRWVVRGFWRNTWYPSSGLHRPQWIAPYLKGPAGAPLLGGEKVTIVGPPRPSAAVTR